MPSMASTFIIVESPSRSSTNLPRAPPSVDASPVDNSSLSRSPYALLYLSTEASFNIASPTLPLLLPLLPSVPYMLYLDNAFP